METIKERVYLYCAEKNIKIRDFERAADLSNGYISSMRTGFGQGKLNNVLLAFPDLNREWLLYGEGSMLKSATADPNQPTRDNYDTTTAQQPANNQPQKHLIPFYDDVNSRGGLGTYVEDTNTPAQPAEWIDAGDWFHEATAAIRHYGDSMIEYPSGSILALKQVCNRNNRVPRHQTTPAARGSSYGILHQSRDLSRRLAYPLTLCHTA